MSGQLSISFILSLLAASPAFGIDDYALGPDSMRQPEVPQGKVTEHDWKTSKVYPGTERKYWIYVPAQYDGSKPASLMVFQDGEGFASETGAYRVPVVFDNLIHKKEMPVTIAVMINPGVIPPSGDQSRPRRNRSYEYDRVTGDYATFLLDEILPEVAKTYKLDGDPNQRAICGNSSGGICAFSVAWHRPDAFRKVVSHIGSFTNIQGGHVYPALIRKTERKPLRVFLQDGSSDLDNMFGNWPLANQEMAAALKYSGYDYKFVYGDGGHTGKHGGSIFPDTLRWLWR